MTNGLLAKPPVAQEPPTLAVRIAELRATSDVEGVARLLLEQGGTKDERRDLRLRPDEARR